MIDKYKHHTLNNRFFEQKRTSQNVQWLHQTIHDELIERFYSNSKVKTELKKIEQQLSQQNVNPYQMAMDLLKKIS